MDAVHAVSCGNAVFSAILCWLWQSLLLGTIFAGVTCLLIRLIRPRIGSFLETCLWSIVLIKFLAPFGLSWTLSPSGTYLSMSESSLPYDVPPASPVALDSADLYAADLDAPDSGNPATALNSRGQSPRTTSAALAQLRWPAIVGMVYLLSVLCLLALRMRSYGALVRRCRKLPGADEQTCGIVIDACRRLGVRRIPSIGISGKGQPFVMGLLHPLLVIPRHLVVRPDELETVIVHEIAHLRRGDMLVRYIEWIAGTVFFFWPIVAWVNRRLDAAREYACDQWALRQGKLSAPDYARLLLGMARIERRRRFAYTPCSMATNPKVIERRIDMILQSQNFSSSRRKLSLVASAFLLAWAGFALTGIAAGPEGTAYSHSGTASEQSVQKRAAAIYNRVRAHDAADFNRDGVLSYLERDTYLVALAMRNAGPFMDEFPYADRNHSGNLDILEANAVIRAITLIAYADRRANAATERVLPLEFCHYALDAQQWLLANFRGEPESKELDQIWSVLRRVQGHPNSFSARMFDRCGPEQLNTSRKIRAGARRQFQELEGGIATIQERLASAKGRDRVARLESKLAKLQAILARLNE